MLIKIMQYTAAAPQQPGDLARLLRYLIEAKSGDKSLDDFVRLAGPPFARRLIQRFMPFGATRRAAADDIAHQLFDHVRRGCAGADSLPRQVYVHIVLSFSPRLRRSKARLKAAAEAQARMDAREQAVAEAKAEAKARWKADVGAQATSGGAVAEVADTNTDAGMAVTLQAVNPSALNSSIPNIHPIQESLFSRTSRIALDALENIGVGEHFPMFLVVHGDKRHVHAHVVVALYVVGSPQCKVHIKAKGKTKPSEIAKSVDLAYGLPPTSRKLKSRHRAVVDSINRLEL